MTTWRLLTAPTPPLVTVVKRVWSDARDACEIVNLSLPDPNPTSPPTQS